MNQAEGPIRISLVVCTRNRCDALGGALAAIAQAARAAPGVGVELVLVDNGSTDGTLAAAAAFARAAPFAVSVISEPAVGLAKARNTGVGCARGEILAFTDDDCRLDPGFFQMLDEQFTGAEAPAIIGGRVLLGDPSDLAFTIKTDEEAQKLDGRIHPGGFVLGCNMAIRREVFDQIGLFDPRFGAGAPFTASEETDFIYRAYRAGFAVEYRPQPTVVHFHGRKTPDDIARLSRGYFIGNGAMYAKHRLGGLWLMRHIASNLTSAVLEAFGGKSFVPDLQISYRDLVGGNLKGMMLYWTYRTPRASRSQR